MVCPACSRVTFFEGRDNAIFASSRMTVYYREIQDLVVYQIAILGDTLRKAYEAVGKVSGCSLARFSRWVVCLYRALGDQ